MEPNLTKHYNTLLSIRDDLWALRNRQISILEDLPEDERGEMQERTIFALEDAHNYVEQAIEYLSRLIP